MVKELIQGFKEFRSDAYEGNSASMPELVLKGQNPEYFVISCIDSRSDPATIFKAVPGAFFAHKAMGAIVRPYGNETALSAALQFALIYNNVTKVIILGHTGCGAIKALVENLDDKEISTFINVAKEGLQVAQNKCDNVCSHDELLRYTEEEIVLQSTENIRTYPSIKIALEENRLEIKPWLFNMSEGSLMEYNFDKKEFISITNNSKAS